MSSNVLNPMIGSGLQAHRKTNAGKFQGITQTVAIVNYEDDIAVESFTESVVTIPSGSSVKVPTINLPRRRAIALNNQGGAPVYIGGTSGVSIASGYPIAVGAEKAFTIGASLDIWAIASGASSQLRVLEIA